MDEGSGDGTSGGKVVVMKTTRRIIRLQVWNNKWILLRALMIRRRFNFHRITSKTPATCRNQCPTSVTACIPTQSRTTSRRIFPQISERTSLCRRGSPQCRTPRRCCTSHWSPFTGDSTLRNSSRGDMHLAEQKLTHNFSFLPIEFTQV